MTTLDKLRSLALELCWSSLCPTATNLPCVLCNGIGWYSTIVPVKCIY